MDQKEHMKKIQTETAKHNKLAQMAMAQERSYITPEDVGEALEGCQTEEEVNKIRLDVLEIMAENAGFGVEDSSLTAFVAFRGKE
jgi:hypothetical protein